MLIRVGLPKTTGEFPGALFDLDHPGLVSANSMWNHARKEFRRPGFAACDLDLALDSAGYVVMKKWGGHYPWTVQQYVELAGLWGWTWWAAMDYCCEQDIATDEEQVLQRVNDTAVKLLEVRLQVASWRAAGATWITDPMPVIQGWAPDDYAASIECTDTVLQGSWPKLVGVGSVCGRHLHGPTGLVSVLERVDAELPAGVQVHLFGVKGVALKHFGDHPRIASMDSMAWDYRARKMAQALRDEQEAKLGWRPAKDDPEWISCDNTLRIQAMKTWVRRQA